jgi:hypothetical protein
MIITSPDVKKVVDHYDIVFESGMCMPLKIDRELGDTIAITETTIIAKLTAKPSQNDPSKMLPAEDVMVFTAKVASIQHREQEVVELSPESKSQWHEEFARMNLKKASRH